MYKINERLAVHGFDFNPETYDLAVNYEYHKFMYGFIRNTKYLKTGQYLDGYKIIDCRDLSEGDMRGYKCLRINHSDTKER